MENNYIKKGSKGDEVLRLQQALLSMGFNPKESNGNFEDGTEAAVKALQEAAGHKVDGIVDKETWDFIMNMTWKETSEPFTMMRNPKNPYQRHMASDVEVNFSNSDTSKVIS